MKKWQAIEILKEQQQTLQSLNRETYSVWKSNALSWVKQIFGENSEEYQYLKAFQFVSFYSDSHEVDIKKNKPIAHLFLENCIKRLNTVGMPKREWKHILITTNPALFWTIFVALLGFAFWFGQVTANKSDKAAQEQPTNKNDSSVHKNVYLKDTTITDSTKQ